MSRLYKTNSDRITFHAKGNYIGLSRAETRAMTIAGFCIAQNSEILSDSPMRKHVVKFLLSNRALNYWIEQGWLAVVSDNDEAGSLIQLTPGGRDKCESSLQGTSAWGTDLGMVTRWIQRMLDGDNIADKSKSFNIPL